LARKAKPGAGLAVLVVDDEPELRHLCRVLLETLGCQVAEAEDLKTARRALAASKFALALIDVVLPDGSGFDLFRDARSKFPALAVGIMTAYASIEDAIQAVKGGAVDYITKPFEIERLKELVEFVAGRLPAGKAQLGRGTFEFYGIVGASDEMRAVCELIERAAEYPSTVLIQGESGTGKELVAKAIHAAGPNAGEPFVAIECSAIPGPLLENELFGHVKGAFTGAHADAPGLFRSAANGTVFLDEIGELPRPFQVKLLRALQEHEVRPVGASGPVPAHARVIVATNRDLHAAMADGEFRRDLFFRLHVIPIYLPPLRTRRDDIAPLAQHFLNRLNAASGRKVRLSRGGLRLLEKRKWMGNVRELQNCIEKAFALNTGKMIDEEQLAGPESASPAPREGERLRDYEKQAIQAALRQAGGNRKRAAKILDIGVATLFRKLKEYKLN